MINPKGFDVYIMQLNSIRKAYIYRNVLQFIFSLKLLHLLWFCCYKKKTPENSQRKFILYRIWEYVPPLSTLPLEIDK